MHVGLSVYNIGARELVDLAVAADELGFESLWLGEHIVLPVGYASEHPTRGTAGHQHHAGPIIDPNTKLLDPLVALSACAARTRSIRLATGIYLAPLRPPIVTARMAHTLHDVSQGRLLLGVGAGWLEEEFAAVGVPFAERGARMEESLAVLRKAWAGGPFSHDGHHFRLEGLQLCEEAVHVPLILGGNSTRALRRAAQHGDGWFASGTPAFDDACRYRDEVLAHRPKDGPAAEFPVYVRIAEADPALITRYQAAGFERVLVWADQVWLAEGDLATKRSALADAAARLGVGAEPVTAGEV